MAVVVHCRQRVDPPVDQVAAGGLLRSPLAVDPPVDQVAAGGLLRSPLAVDPPLDQVAAGGFLRSPLADQILPPLGARVPLFLVSSHKVKRVDRSAQSVLLCQHKTAKGVRLVN